MMNIKSRKYGSSRPAAEAADRLEELEREVIRLRARLSEEIKWGHRLCTPGNCESSGTDCPANAGAQAPSEAR